MDENKQPSDMTKEEIEEEMIERNVDGRENDVRYIQLRQYSCNHTTYARTEDGRCCGCGKVM